MEERNKILKVEVSGKDERIWSELRSKLIEAVNKFLDSTIDFENQSTIRDEAKKFTTALLNSAKAKLQKDVIGNEKTLAEIDLIYSQKTKELAEARKINAEAAEIEFQTSLKKLKLSLGVSKALLIGEEGREDIIFVKQMDAFLEVINEFAAERKYLE